MAPCYQPRPGNAPQLPPTDRQTLPHLICGSVPRRGQDDHGWIPGKPARPEGGSVPRMRLQEAATPRSRPRRGTRRAAWRQQVGMGPGGGPGVARPLEVSEAQGRRQQLRPGRWTWTAPWSPGRGTTSPAHTARRRRARTHPWRSDPSAPCTSRSRRGVGVLVGRSNVSGCVEHLPLVQYRHDRWPSIRRCGPAGSHAVVLVRLVDDPARVALLEVRMSRWWVARLVNRCAAVS